uniref:Uncharacterized protein LOC102806282 n=1 Tax=Saccoglossus kowalevskii TaxID=10224 RepID=A0ABM0M5K9_SACKO|nr:PREDICTED: uncharacterized protein LOC102806282 [Saccoglossus kowalevskii]
MSVLPCDDLATDGAVVDFIDGSEQMSVFTDVKPKDLNMKGGYSFNDLSKEKTVKHHHCSRSVCLSTKNEKNDKKKGRIKAEKGYKRNPSEEINGVKKLEGYMRDVNGYGVNNIKNSQFYETVPVKITVPMENIANKLNTTEATIQNREPDTVIKVKVNMVIMDEDGQEVRKTISDVKRNAKVDKYGIGIVDGVGIVTKVKEKSSSDFWKDIKAADESIDAVTEMMERAEINDEGPAIREPVEDDEDDAAYHVYQRHGEEESIVTITPKIVAVMETTDNEPNRVDDPIDCLSESISQVNLSKKYVPLEKHLKKTRNKCIKDRIGVNLRYPDNKENLMLAMRGDSDTVTTSPNDEKESNVTPRGINNDSGQQWGNNTTHFSFTGASRATMYQQNHYVGPFPNSMMPADHQTYNVDTQYQYIQSPTHHEPLQSSHNIQQHFSPEMQYNGNFVIDSQYLTQPPQPHQPHKRALNIDPLEEDRSKRLFVEEHLPELPVSDIDKVLPNSGNLYDENTSLESNTKTTTSYTVRSNGLGRVIEAQTPTTIKPILIENIIDSDESTRCSVLGSPSMFTTHVNNGYAASQESSVGSPHSAVSSPVNSPFSPTPSTNSTLSIDTPMMVSPGSSIISSTGPPSNLSSHTSLETGYETDVFQPVEEEEPYTQRHISHPQITVHNGVQKIFSEGKWFCLVPDPSTSFNMPRQPSLSVVEDMEYRRIEATHINKLTDSDEDGDTALHIATAQRNTPLCKAMIFKLERESKITLDAQDNLGQTPLSLAILTDLREIIDCLITVGASISKSTHDGQTIFHCAAERGFVDAVQTVYTAIVRYNNSLPQFEEKVRPDMDAKNNEGLTALHVAVLSHGTRKRVYVSERESDIIVDSTKMIELLLSMGSSTLCQDGKSGKTALHFAAERGLGELMTILLSWQDEQRELVNYPMYNGNTTLHLVVGSNRPEHEILKLVEILYRHGADPSIENAEKEKAIACSNKKHKKVNKKLKSGQTH